MLLKAELVLAFSQDFRNIIHFISLNNEKNLHYNCRIYLLEAITNLGSEFAEIFPTLCLKPGLFLLYMKLAYPTEK